jgi:hypothetical protein
MAEKCFDCRINPTWGKCDGPLCYLACDKHRTPDMTRLGDYSALREAGARRAYEREKAVIDAFLEDQPAGTSP